MLLPKPALAGCLFAAVVRDTRGIKLKDSERYNFFPASPLVTLTYIIEGKSHLALGSIEGEHVKLASAIAPITIAGPQTKPFISWNPGQVFAISIGFYPDAWRKLTGMSPHDLVNRTVDTIPSVILDLLQSCSMHDADQFWGGFQEALLPQWSLTRASESYGINAYGHYISDWCRTVVARASMSGPARTIRAIQRHLQRWTGHSRRSLESFERIETLHRLATAGGGANPAALALEAGYSDQSHMGRAVRKSTGFSPVHLNRMIENEESFWCYRLLGERF